MIDIIRKIEAQIEDNLDHDKFLLAGNAFGKKSLFLFKKGNNYPDYVARIPYSIEGINKCKNELKALNYLKQIVFDNLICPEAIGEFNINHKQVYIQKIVKFKLMISGIIMHKKMLPESFFKRVTEVLVEIYSTTRNTIDGVEYCFQHGDFWAGNIGINQNKLVLLDFEFSTIKGKPLFDLLHFGLYFKVVSLNIGMVTHVGSDSIVDKRTFEPDKDTVMALLLANDALATVMRKSILNYLNGCSLSKGQGIDLIKEYIEVDRGIQNLPLHWEQEIFRE